MRNQAEINGEDKLYIEKHEIIESLNNNIIVKVHGMSPEFIWNGLDRPPELKIVGIVRNPRDRAVSYTFHYKYHGWETYDCLPHLNDSDAVRCIVLDNVHFNLRNWYQFYLMKEGYSTKNKVLFDIPYIWTSYKWLKNDTYGELTKILEFLGADINEERIQRVVRRNEFVARTGRNEGVEKRDDMWKRKGIMNDWVNWFDDDMIKATENIQNKYNSILEREENAGSRLS